MQSAPPVLCEIQRGPLIESVHRGHAVVCDGTGQIIEAFGDPEKVVYPRSSSKMIQALPLVTSGAADAFGLQTHQLALACASHNGAAIHTDPVTTWLGELGLAETDLRCGPQPPKDSDARAVLRTTGDTPCQIHNNCSGKHSGFLTLNKHLGGHSEYIEPDHPVQVMAKEAFEMVTDSPSPGYGIDGCSAPNYATTMHGMARAMAWYATAHTRSDSASRAATRLVEAMMKYPQLVAGEERACTELMRAAGGKAALKGGAEAYYVAILPQKEIGIALKIEDGNARGSEAAIAALLIRYGVIEPNHPALQPFIANPMRNWRGVETGMLRPAAMLMEPC